ncbi:MAG: hypothetical protein KBC33_02115 [Candidatus Pacebacteria bacterium]|nr:hypothetical protein [Candidatus Paceibacterota bacterium]
MIARIRQSLQARLGRFLQPRLGNGFFVCDTKEPGEVTLTRMALQVEKSRFMGIVPVFSVVKTGSVRFTEIVTSITRAVRTTLAKQLNEVPATVLASASNGFDAIAAKHVSQIQAKVAAETARLVQMFEGTHLQTLVKSDRNLFRQKLLEELGKQTTAIFAEKAKKHLAELVMRVREEVLPEDDATGSGDGDSPALPTGTRFCVRNGKMTVFVIEQPPQKRTLKIMAEDGARSQSYQLSLPYMVFFVVLRGRKSDNMYAFFRKAPLRSMQDDLLCVATPNIYSDFRVCFSASAAKPSLAEMAEESIGNFWGGRFIETHDPSNLTNQISFEKWEAQSKKDSLFGLSYTWRSARKSVAEMLKIISAEFQDGSKAIKKDKDGKVIMTALDRAVEGIAVTMSNGMKEACFNLVPGWNIDGPQLQQLTGELKNTVAGAAEFTRSELSKGAESIFSHESIKEALQKAVQQTLKSMDANTGEPVLAAQKAFFDEQKRNTNDTDSHQETR